MSGHGLFLVWTIGSCSAMAWEGYAVPRASRDVRFAAAMAYKTHDAARLQATCARLMSAFPVNVLTLLIAAALGWPYLLYKASRVLWNWRHHRR